MKRTLILALVFVTALLAGGAALAKNIDCTGGLCAGTKKADIIVGTTGGDEIVGRGGNDRIIGDFDDGHGDDLIRGGGGGDTITDNRPFPDVDTILGGKGSDFINVREGAAGGDDPDAVDCRPGTDTVFVDPGDTRIDCEILNPS